MSLTKVPTDASRPCVFCNTTEDNEIKYGKLYHKDDITTHYFCLLLSSNMQQRGKDEEGILGFLLNDIKAEVRRGRRLWCAYCRKRGATLGCCNARCPKSFHLPCGLTNKTLHLFYNEFRSYCVNHRPTDDYLTKLLTNTTETFQCNICYDDIDATDKYSNLLAPCCQETALFHRDCIQKFAMTSGYFFKCPLCNNKKTFKYAMIKNGIFVPCQDAAWELEPDAFNELLYKHDRCDADNCVCPAGRYFTTDDKWQLVLCHTCASQGIHVECGGFNKKEPSWNCNECKEILDKSSNDNFNERKSGVSDGASTVESFVNNLFINLRNSFRKQTRPGPRSSKIKLLRKLRRIYESDRRKFLRNIASSNLREFNVINMNPMPIDEAIRSLSHLLSSGENGDDREAENYSNDEETASADSTSIFVNNADEEIEIVQLPTNSIIRRNDPSIFSGNSTVIIGNKDVGSTLLGANVGGDLGQLSGGINNYSLFSLPGPSQLNSNVDRQTIMQFSSQNGNVGDNGAVRVAGPILQQDKNDENMKIVGCHQAANSESQMVTDSSNNGIVEQNSMINFMGMFFTYCPLKLITRQP